jgi:putative N6-adenine-specific DNA methylase
MEYQKSNRYFVQVAGSLEKHAREELSELGATVLKEVPRGLYITCSPQCLYRVVYTSRLAQRVLAPLASFSCHSEKYLYAMASKLIDWTSLFSLDQSFGIDSNVSASKINHSLYAGHAWRRIATSFESAGGRPDFQSRWTDINFNLHYP